MILLLGGTSETARIAESLAGAGYEVLVSTATDISLHVGMHPAIHRRQGSLDEEGFAEVIGSRGIRAVVDATHPYAERVREIAGKTAARMDVPLLSYVRPASAPQDDEIVSVATHADAARAACSFGCPIFLTIGSRNLGTYIAQARAVGVECIARVLPEEESVRASILAGVPEDRILSGRGPFSVEENRAAIQKFKIGVLVTKDSGAAGGLPEKIEAARLEKCRIVLLRRPPRPSENVFENISDLLQAVRERVPPAAARRGRRGG